MSERTPIPFMPAATIPIVGQAFALKGGYATALVQCRCEAMEPVLLIGNAPGFCAACRRGFAIVSFAFNGQTGQITVNIGLVQPHVGVPS